MDELATLTSKREKVGSGSRVLQKYGNEFGDEGSRRRETEVITLPGHLLQTGASPWRIPFSRISSRKPSNTGDGERGNQRVNEVETCLKRWWEGKSRRTTKVLSRC